MTQKARKSHLLLFLLKNKSVLYFGALVLTFAACKRVENPELKGPSYAPLEVGKYIIYDVMNLSHDAFTQRTDTAHYLLRETIENNYIDEAGNSVFQLLIETSKDSGTTWNFDKYAIAQRDEVSYQRVEDDIRKVKLSFPLREKKSWDANQMNVLADQRARLLNIDQEYTLANGTTFNNSVEVDLGNDVDPFFQNIESEVYANGIGLVWRILVAVESQPGKYTEGNEYIQTYKQSNW